MDKEFRYRDYLGDDLIKSYTILFGNDPIETYWKCNKCQMNHTYLYQLNEKIEKNEFQCVICNNITKLSTNI
jgi:hypothetical protein